MDKESKRNILLAGIYYNGTLKEGEADPLRNFLITQEIAMDMGVNDAGVGQQVRAKVQGIRLIEMAFDEMDKFLPAKTDKKEKKNPAL